MRSTTPLHQALLKQNMDVVELLLAFGSDSSHISRDDLIRQVCRDRNLYKHKNQHKNCDVEYRAFFLHAVATGKSEVVELLVDKVMVKPFFTDKDGFMPLHYAVKHGYPKIVTYLLSLAKLPSKLRRSPTIKILFCCALTGGDDEVVRELLTTCPREVGLGEKLLTGETLLHIARTALSVTLLLGAGVNINTRDRHLRTPLHTAATAGRVEVVQALLARGALSRLWDGDGMTPLNRAVMAREWGVVKAMARAGRKWGVDVTLKDRCGMTAVEKARAAGLEEDSVTMKLLTNVPATQTPKKVRRKVSAPTVVMDAKVKKGSSAKGEKRRFKTGGVQTAG